MDNISYFFMLLVISEFIRRFFIKKPYPSASSGSIIMAIGIFSLYALQQLPFTTHLITRLITLELFIIWLYLANFFIRKQQLVEQFGIGTWVAGSAVLAVLFLTELPSWIPIIYCLSLLACFIWLFYLNFLFRHLPFLLFKKPESQTGIILLSTVSTQSIVLLLNALFANQTFTLLNQLLIILGYIFYIIGIAIIVKCFVSTKWNSTNSIIHGALSITGLASTLTNAFNDKQIIFTWILASSLFLLIEGLSIIKITFIYDESQWSRIFTYGMYYAFTFSIVNHNIYQNLVTKEIVQYGQYIVFIMVSVEILLFLKAQQGK